VNRDLAFTLSADVPVADVMKSISDNAGELLADLSVFDVYQGAGIAEGKKSLAFSLVLRSMERTLADVEIEQIMTRVIDAVQRSFSAVLRGETSAQP
jgi:phenylalanyl-tRNA synthetase beta chain